MRMVSGGSITGLESMDPDKRSSISLSPNIYCTSGLRGMERFLDEGLLSVGLPRAGNLSGSAPFKRSSLVSRSRLKLLSLSSNARC